MGLHPKVPHVAFLGLVHLRIAFFLRVLGRGGSDNNGSIDDRALTYTSPNPLNRSFNQRFPRGYPAVPIVSHAAVAPTPTASFIKAWGNAQLPIKHGKSAEGAFHFCR